MLTCAYKIATKNRLISELALLKTAAAAATDDAAAATGTTSTTTTSSLSRSEASGHLVGLLSALSDCVSALDGSGRGRHDALLGQALSLSAWSVDEVILFPFLSFRPLHHFLLLLSFFLLLRIRREDESSNESNKTFPV